MATGALLGVWFTPAARALVFTRGQDAGHRFQEPHAGDPAARLSARPPAAR